MLKSADYFSKYRDKIDSRMIHLDLVVFGVELVSVQLS
jgi:hypothetical protein